MKLVFKQGVTLGGDKVAKEGDTIELDKIPAHLVGRVELLAEDEPKKRSRKKTEDTEG